MRVALAYIASHRDAVEADYLQVLAGADESRQYWEDRNRERLAQIASLPLRPGTEEIRAKLAHHRAERAKERSAGSNQA
jgi:hypothetical protein